MELFHSIQKIAKDRRLSMHKSSHHESFEQQIFKALGQFWLICNSFLIPSILLSALTLFSELKHQMLASVFDLFS